MKVLVTGGSGFIGSNVVRVLEERGVKVVILDDFSSANFKNLEGLKADVIWGDVSDENILKKMPQVRAVIHEAAITDTTSTDNKRTVMVNFNGFKNVLNFCLRRKIKFIYASSAGVYGNGPYPARESQRLSPLNVYAYSKYLCDCLAEKIMKKAESLIVGLRYFNVYGSGEYHKKTAASMIYQLFLQMRENKVPCIFKFGEQKRDFIYVKDVAMITAESLNFKKSVILNVGTGEARSFNEIISILNKLLKKKLEPHYFDNPYKGTYQNYTQADIELLKKLNLSPKFNLERGMRDYVTRYLSNDGNKS